MTVSSFEELKPEELYRSAIEDFAVDVKKGDSKKVILAALLESGVSWSDYVQQHPEVAPVVEEVKPVAPVTPDYVVTSEDVRPTRVEPVVRTAQPPVAGPGDLYLVKMNRPNPYFEFRQFKFSKANPYVVMDAASTNAILTEEDGFSIATPAEAAEYYA